MQGPVPLQAPLQPANVDGASAVAVKVTKVPSVYVAEQVAPQLMPAGELVTVPVPVPARLTLSVLSEDVKVAVLCCPWPQYRNLKFNDKTTVITPWKI